MAVLFLPIFIIFRTVEFNSFLGFFLFKGPLVDELDGVLGVGGPGDGFGRNFEMMVVYEVEVLEALGDPRDDLVDFLGLKRAVSLLTVFYLIRKPGRRLPVQQEKSIGVAAVGLLAYGLLVQQFSHKGRGVLHFLMDDVFYFERVIIVGALELPANEEAFVVLALEAIAVLVVLGLGEDVIVLLEVVLGRLAVVAHG